jgi:hypothetical protein
MLPLQTGKTPSAADKNQCALKKLAEADDERLWTTPASNAWLLISHQATFMADVSGAQHLN